MLFLQQIIDAVSGNLNKCYAKFCERNPNFNGSVSVSGHSLGSLILFDLLQHQRIEMENKENLENSTQIKPPLKRHCSQQINYTIGHAGTGQPYIQYPQLNFQPKHFFALGSPIGKISYDSKTVFGKQLNSKTLFCRNVCYNSWYRCAWR